RAELFESFLHTKYVGKKRFSIEGAETLIPMIGSFLEKVAADGAQEVVFGMSHRGRLNVLTSILNKPCEQLFCEFEDIPYGQFEGSGDVPYHKGYRSRVTLASGNMLDLWLVDNPSHLESVDPVMEGIVRAHQNVGVYSVPLLIHGDAAVAGQGVVYETLQLSQLRGYSTGGTVHIVINNNVGFTASPEDSRSTLYCTDIAKAFGLPVIHVNAEEPERCIWAIECAFAVRKRFGIDVFIDLDCYRKHGHNEGDEPAFTQPLLYQSLRKKEPIRALYAKKLIESGILAKEAIVEADNAMRQALQTTLNEVKQKRPIKEVKVVAVQEEASTAVDRKRLEDIIKAITKVPEGFSLHPRLQHAVSERAKQISIDWSFAETLALGSLLQE
ncbi:MAG: 2-oxoglutarate dehydrogenase subunit E1, partial [Verrucomicrobia bacterium]|nr:2-oxoglutarate dehydrogenase subunit E1 [Verrucomicrobiota bacterium]